MRVRRNCGWHRLSAGLATLQRTGLHSKVILAPAYLGCGRRVLKASAKLTKDLGPTRLTRRGPARRNYARAVTTPALRYVRGGRECIVRSAIGSDAERMMRDRWYVCAGDVRARPKAANLQGVEGIRAIVRSVANVDDSIDVVGGRVRIVERLAPRSAAGKS